MLRVHQWAKNLLVFVPLVSAQAFTLIAFGNAVGAFVAFSLAASAMYIINDLVDLDSDRKHPRKNRRPLAAATVSITRAAALAPVLLVVAFGLALFVGNLFAATLATYVILTMAYTFSLKRKMLIDVIALALLYTIRVIGGAAAISVFVSEWLLGFSMFIFTALALIKRYVELAVRVDESLPDPAVGTTANLISTLSRLWRLPRVSTRLQCLRSTFHRIRSAVLIDIRWRSG